MNKVIGYISSHIYLKNLAFLPFLILSLVTNGLIWLNIYLNLDILKKKEEFLVMHYNLETGIDLLGPWYHIFIIPSFALIFILINFIFARFINNKDKAAANLLTFSCWLVQLFCLLAIFLLVDANKL